MKKLTKTEKENRLRKFRKVKDILLYISLAVNALILTCVSIVGCSQKSDDHPQLNNNLVKNQLVNRNYANNYDYPNDNVICYNIYQDGIKQTTQPINVVNQRYPYSYFTLVSGDVVSGISYVYFDFVIHSPNIVGDHYNISFYDSSNEFIIRSAYYLTSNGWEFDCVDYNGNNLSYCCLALNDDALLDNSFGISYYLDYIYERVTYTDFQMSQNWSPLAVFKHAWRANANIIGNYQYLTNYNYNGIVFSVRGLLFDSIRVFWSGSDSSFMIDGEITKVSGYDTIIWCEYYNRTNGNSLTFMSMPTSVYDTNGNTNLYYDFDKGLQIVNYDLLNIRLFDVNLNEFAFDSYTNYDIFNIQTNYYSGGIDTFNGGGLGDVFGLFKTAFVGLTGLFSISILPNITIGMLLFLPLVGGIIFAIVKIIKK